MLTKLQACMRNILRLNFNVLTQTADTTHNPRWFLADENDIRIHWYLYKPTANESLPKIIVNNTIDLFFFKTAISILVTSNHRGLTVSERCWTKLLQYILFEKYIYISALEMARRRNRHSASCIRTLSFAIVIRQADKSQVRNCQLQRRTRHASQRYTCKN